MKNKWLTITAAAAAIAGFGACAQANSVTALSDGASVTFSDTATYGFSGGSAEVNAIIQTLPTVGGSVASSYNTSSTGPNPLGGLVFMYQVQLTAGQATLVTISGFGNIATDVGYSLVNGGGLPVGTVAPVSASRSSDGSVIDFYFNGDFSSTTTATLIVDTGVQTHGQGVVLVQDGDQGYASAYVPIVPDGGLTVAFLGLAFAGVEGLRRKLRK
jgi:hypothetical protein